jgi:hypothetical protein
MKTFLRMAANLPSVETAIRARGQECHAEANETHLRIHGLARGFVLALARTFCASAVTASHIDGESLATGRRTPTVERRAWRLARPRRDRAGDRRLRIAPPGPRCARHAMIRKLSVGEYRLYRRTVVGWTSRVAARWAGAKRAARPMVKRCHGAHRTRLTRFRSAPMSCWRSNRFSATSELRPRSRSPATPARNRTRSLMGVPYLDRCPDGTCSQHGRAAARGVRSAGARRWRRRWHG